MTETNRVEERIILLTSIGHCLCHVCELAFAGLITAVMVEFGLPVDEVAALAIPGFILFGVGALPAGVWADRRSSYEALNGFFLLVVAACLTVYYATTPLGLGAALAFLGAAISIYHPAGLAMISHGCRRRGRAMGINGVAGSFGVALGPSLGIFVAANYSWRLTYLIIACLALLGFVLSVVLGKGLNQIGHHGSTITSKKANGQSLGVFAILFVAMLLGGVNYRCITTALPNYLNYLATEDTDQPLPDIASENQRQVYGGKTQDETTSKIKAHGSGIVFFVFAAGGIGQLLGGFLADRIRPALGYCCVIGLTIPFALMIGRSSVGNATVFATFFAIFMFAEQPLENTMIAEATKPKWRSTVYGLKFILAFGLSSFGIFLAGSIWRYYGLAKVFDFYVVGALAMASFAVLYWKLSARVTKSDDEESAGKLA